MITLIYIVGFVVIFIIVLILFFPIVVVKTLLKLGQEFKKDSFKQRLTFFLLMEFMGKEQPAITIITKFFPFSLLYKGSLVHAENKSTKILVRSLESYLEDRKMPISINSGDLRPPLATLLAVPVGHYKISKTKYLVKLEKEIQKKYEAVYIREDKTGFRILIPSEAVDQIISKQ